MVGGAIDLGAEHVLRCRVRSGSETGLVRWPYASDRELRLGDFVQIDLVGIHKGYVFDVSRAWVAGAGNSSQLEAINLAEQLTRSLIDCLKADLSIAVAIDRWRMINDMPPKYNVNLDGHSVGIDVVEPPWITPFEPFCLKSGMVFCVEPSINFNDGYALKVEETILIAKGGNVVLSAL